MKYKCLVFDHDDTVVNSTATIHFPCFEEYLNIYYPDESITLQEYFLLNFDPGFATMCRQNYRMTEEDMEQEMIFWKAYVQNHIPECYPGIKKIMEKQKQESGLICVVSHSLDFNIRRDYEKNGLPEPDAIYGWERPENERKPAPFPLYDIMKKFNLKPQELLMIDDLKPGYDMATAAGVDFAAAGWAYEIPEIEIYMRKNCERYFKSTEQLSAWLDS